jgi:hypothetical protein
MSDRIFKSDTKEQDAILHLTLCKMPLLTRIPPPATCTEVG